MQRFAGVTYYAQRPRKAVSVYEEYGKRDPAKKVTFDLGKKKRKR